jgi:hypothetical protein
MTNTGPTRDTEDDSLFRGLFARREPSPAATTLTPSEERIAESVDERVDKLIASM